MGRGEPCHGHHVLGRRASGDAGAVPSDVAVTGVVVVAQGLSESISESEPSADRRWREPRQRPQDQRSYDRAYGARGNNRKHACGLSDRPIVTP